MVSRAISLQNKTLMYFRTDTGRRYMSIDPGSGCMSIDTGRGCMSIEVYLTFCGDC